MWCYSCISPFRHRSRDRTPLDYNFALVVDGVGDTGVELESVVNRAREKLVLHGGCIAAVVAHNLTDINVGSESCWGTSSESLVVRVVVSVFVGMSNLVVACDKGSWVADMHNGDADVCVGDNIRASHNPKLPMVNQNQTVPRAKLEQSM
jgi:hypothetical protein